MPIIEIELTDEEAKALLGIDKPSPSELAEAIRRRVLSEASEEVSGEVSQPVPVEGVARRRLAR